MKLQRLAEALYVIAALCFVIEFVLDIFNPRRAKHANFIALGLTLWALARIIQVSCK